MTGPGASRELLAGQLVDALRAAGTDLVFGMPGGGSNLDVVGAVEAAGARFVLTHGETAAAIMAGVTAELTGCPSACVATRGPGAASAVNGVAQCLLDRQPVLLITDCVTGDERERVSHQRLDHQALLSAVTKASVRFGAHEGPLAERLVALTATGRPGPVHVDLDPTAPFQTASLPTASPEQRGDLAAARAALDAARRPVIVAGVGAVTIPAERRQCVQDALARLLDGTAVPVLTTYKARGVVDDRGPHAAGVATGATIEAPLLHEADLIIGLGLDPVELIPAAWPYRAPMLLLGGWPINDSTYFGDRVTVELVGDLDVLLDELGPAGRSEWDASDASRHRAAAEDRLRAAVPATPAGLSPQSVVDITRQLAPAGTVATVDAGAHMLVAVPLWTVGAPGELLVSSGLATMGFALPAATAAALVDPGRRVVCFTGDGGAGMALAELETLARLRLDVVIVVFNDASLSLIAIKQRAEGHGGDRAVRYAPTDFAAIAAGCGVTGHRVGDTGTFHREMAAALRRRGPTLLDVTVDPSAYGAVLDAIRGGAAG